MITEGIINLLFACLSGLFSLLPDMTWSVETTAFQYLRDFCDMICYLLPIGTVTAIVTLVISVAFLRIAIAFIRTVWKFIPVLGS